MEAALKLARQYFLELKPAQDQRTRFISRKQSYHGITLGALAVSGHKLRRQKFEPLFMDTVSQVSPCNELRGKKAGESDEEYVARLAIELDEEFQRIGPDSVCAFIAEPIVGAVSLLSITRSGAAADYTCTGSRVCSICSGLLPSRCCCLQEVRGSPHPRRGHVRDGPQRYSACLGAGGHRPRYPDNRQSSRWWVSADSRNTGEPYGD